MSCYLPKCKKGFNITTIIARIEKMIRVPYVDSVIMYIHPLDTYFLMHKPLPIYRT